MVNFTSGSKLSIKRWLFKVWSSNQTSGTFTMIRRISLIPLTIALLFFPSVRYSLALDGWESDYYGFPLPWNSNSLITSLAKDVYALPLAIDMILLAILSVFVIKALARFPQRVFKSVMMALWAWGLLCAITIAIVLSSGTTFYLWPSPGPFHLSEVRLSRGL